MFANQFFSTIGKDELNNLVFEVLSHSSDEIVIMDDNDLIQYVNQAFARKVNISSENIIGRSGKEMFPEWVHYLDLYRKNCQTGTVDHNIRAQNRIEQKMADWGLSIIPVKLSDSVTENWVLQRHQKPNNHIFKTKQEDFSYNQSSYQLLLEAFKRIPTALALMEGQSLALKIANPYYQKLLNKPYQSIDLTGLTFDEYAPLECKETLLRQLREVASTGVPCIVDEYQYNSMRKGKMYWRYSIIPLPGQNGVFDIVIAIVDITVPIFQRIQLEECALQAQMYLCQLETILNTIPDGVIMTEAPSGKLIFANHQHMKLHNKTFLPSEFNKRYNSYQLLYKDGRPIPLEESAMYKAMNGEIVTNMEAYVRDQDGTFNNLLLNGAPVYDYEGNLISAVVVTHDITEMKMAMTKAALANQMEQIVDFMPDAIMVLDRDHKVIAWNREKERTTGIQKKDMIGQDSTNIAKFYFGEVHPILPEIVLGVAATPYEASKLVREGDVISAEFKWITPEKTRYLEVKASPLRNDAGQIDGAIEIVRDITRQKELESENIRIQKLESLGIMAGGIAHDFNNILAVVISNLQLITLKLQKKQDVLRNLQETIETVYRASTLTKQLLTFSRGGAPVKKPSSMNDLVKETVEFALRGSNVKAKFVIQENLWTVDIDVGQIAQVISNLTINAEQAMPNGGIFKIYCENVELGPESKYHSGFYVKLTFEDQGVGIPEEIIHQIFDPFFTTKKQGTGLGLTTSFSIVKKHDGYIEVESIPGKGATFQVYLPASHQAVAATMEPTEVENCPMLNILFMDDEAKIREAIGGLLTQFGHNMVLTADGRETIKAYQAAFQAGKPFDVVIMDLTIPGGMGGLETIAALRKMDPNVKAIVSSGYADDTIMSDYEEYGFQGVVAKPYKIEELNEVLRVITL